MNAQLISARSLANGHVFSFSAQSYLSDLFASVGPDAEPLAIVAGAGVSVNSGLPTWRELVTNLTDQIDDISDGTREMVRKFDADPSRKADLILQLAQGANQNRSESEIMRDALYPKNSPAQAGSLANAIARLVVTRSSVTYLVTTNFDLLLEDALTRLAGDGPNVKSFGLKEFDDWKSWCEKDGQYGVLHVHGILRQGKEPTEPVILTQSQFLRHGTEVQSRIREVLDFGVGLFVGLSMTDPNLIGPLYLKAHDKTGITPKSVKPMKSNGCRLFALSVVEMDAAPEDLRFQQASFAVDSVRFLEKVLNLGPILLKSFSQLDQVVSDLALCVSEPDAYRKSKSENCLYYGVRSQRAIAICHKAIGSHSKPFVPRGDDAANLSNKLRRLLDAQNGPRRLLQRLAKEYSLDYSAGEEEHFGLYLWLRGQDKEYKKPSYNLKLVASSAFQALDPWFIGRDIAIERQTNFAAAQCLFNGSMVKTNLESVSNSGLWRGVMAVPIILTETVSSAQVCGQPLDRIMVGALTLDSSYYVDEDSARLVAHDADQRLGVLTKLDAEDQEEVRLSLDRVAAKILDQS